jgi:hypothetical protein
VDVTYKNDDEEGEFFFGGFLWLFMWGRGMRVKRQRGWSGGKGTEEHG